MWDSVFENVGVEKLLPRGGQWRLLSYRTEGDATLIMFKKFGETLRVEVKCEPVFFAVSDDFTEDYTGMNSEPMVERRRHGVSLEQANANLSASWDTAAEPSAYLHAYVEYAMDQRIRLVCRGIASLREITE